MWVVYTGDVAVAYGAELTALSIARQFLENGIVTEARILVVERASDF